MRRSQWCFPLLFLLLLAGCSRSSIEQVKISGKVLYRGKPLPGGVVTFMSAKGFSSTATIDSDGNYQVTAPVGDVKIVVDNRMLRKTSRNQMLKPSAEATTHQPIAGVYVPIPEKYSSADTSSLTCATATVPSPFDIVLE